MGISQKKKNIYIFIQSDLFTIVDFDIKSRLGIQGLCTRITI